MTVTPPDGARPPSGGPTADPTPTGADDPWARAIDRALRGEGFALAFQPIVDMQHAAVVGYEALSRFDGVPAGVPPSPPPEWFGHARSLGVLPELEARVLSRALDARDRLPPNTFLTVNVSPEAFSSDLVRRVLFSPRGLHRIVVEIAEDAAVEDPRGVAETVEGIRDRGAYLAVDHAGASHAALTHILELRPDFVKLDRALVAGLAQDEARYTLVEMYGQFAARLDAWVLAEGVETVGDLTALARLGVPLAQGYLLGRPSPEWASLPVEIRELLVRAANLAVERLTVQPFVEPWPYVEHGREAEGAALVEAAGAPAMAVLPVLDEFRRPIGLYTLGEPGPVRPVTILKGATPVAEAARRAITRPLARRFDPLVCIDDIGDYAGVVRLERLIEALTGALGTPSERRAA